MTPTYFADAAAWRSWLAKHHAGASELLVGFWKRDSGRPSPTWSEAVDEALCYGWIDGVRRSVDGERYAIRFTPRKPASVWSAINVAKFEALEKAGKMTDAGRAAFAKRRENRSGIYSYENRPRELPSPYREKLDRKRKAAADFASRTPSYRRTATWWILSAKTEATREKRLAQLIELHARGESLPQFRRRPGKS